MKLNAAAEMEAITWPEFADLHPFAPLDQAPARGELIADLERWLAEITGYDAVSLQPNAGAQGELAGLLAIRGYHRSRGDDRPRRLPDPVLGARHQRRLAVMAGHAGGGGACDDDGNVDVDDLKRLVEHADDGWPR
jgi:glycine dehydrogenase